MKDEIVKYKTAKLAKEKGFIWDVKEAYYTTKDELSKVMREECWDGYPVNTEDEDYLAAPTQSLLRRWLREEHSTHIRMHYNISKSHVCSYKINSYDKYKVLSRGDGFEDTLEKGLQKLLKQIK